MRYEFEYNIYKKGDKNAYKTQQGINKTKPALFDFTPGLDIIITRPPDPVHLEYKGTFGRLCKIIVLKLIFIFLSIAAYMYKMLIDVFLTPPTYLEYYYIL